MNSIDFDNEQMANALWEELREERNSLDSERWVKAIVDFLAAAREDYRRAQDRRSKPRPPTLKNLIVRGTRDAGGSHLALTNAVTPVRT